MRKLVFEHGRDVYVSQWLTGEQAPWACEIIRNSEETKQQHTTNMTQPVATISTTHLDQFSKWRKRFYEKLSNCIKTIKKNCKIILPDLFSRFPRGGAAERREAKNKWLFRANTWEVLHIQVVNWNIQYQYSTRDNLLRQTTQLGENIK